MSSSPLLSRSDAEDFLYMEAELLDGWQLDDWLGLCADNVTYEIPATGLPDGDAASSLFLVHDDRYMLEARVKRLMSRNAHAENPRSRTRRLVTNVRIDPPGNAEEVSLRASFHVIRFRDDDMHQYVGVYSYRLRITDDGPRITYRRATLDADSLRHSGGKVSILL